MANSPQCQVEAMPLHLINTPSGQVRVTPCNSENIEPFSMVNSLPCQVGAMSSHPINVLSGPLRVTSLISSQVSASNSLCVTPVFPLAISVPVLALITDGSPPVTFPLCPLSPYAFSSPLKTMQTMSHEQPVDLPIGLDHP